jgi:hypothetical protein
MKIGLCMFYDDNIADYSENCMKINKFYCDKHNIELIVSKTHKKRDRKPHWERIYLLLEHLSKFDYLIWIDSDAFFYEDSKHISTVIESNPDVPFIFSNDQGNQHINTGFFIVKNTQYSFDFLKKWGYDEEILNYSLKLQRWHDQDGLIYMFDNNILDIRNNSILIDYGVLQHFYIDENFKPEPYIFHMAGKNRKLRIQLSKSYLEIVKKRIQQKRVQPKSFKMILF